MIKVYNENQVLLIKIVPIIISDLNSVNEGNICRSCFLYRTFDHMYLYSLTCYDLGLLYFANELISYYESKK